MNRTESNQAAPNGELAAIVAAAGYSSRMKAFKPLLPFGRSTVIETALDVFLEAGIKDITVVLGFNAEKLKPILQRKGIGWVYNEDYSQGMYSSVVAGVRSLKPQTKGVFFLPADIPTVKSSTIAALRDVFLQENSTVVYPAYKGRRGHPPLISSALFGDILVYDGEGGLKTLLGRHSHKAHVIEVEDEGMLYDLDTYEDYQTLYQVYERCKQDGNLK